MIKKSGYYSTFRLHIDENVGLALYEAANKHNVTPDYYIENLLESLLR